jgi:polar amino acid transport system substrate-binding protein
VTASMWKRRELLRLGTLAAGAVAAPSLVAACSRTDTGAGAGANGAGAGGGLLARSKERGYITVGFAGEQPYAFQQGGELTGEDPTVHKEIWNALGIKELRGVQVDFGQLIPGLNANRFDVVAAGMFILPERCAQAAFSEPVYCAPQAFLVPKGNPNQISTYESVAKAGIALGVSPGAVEGIQAKELGVANNKIIEVASQRDALSALAAGRIQAFALTSISLRNMVENNPDANVEMTEPFTPVIDGKEQTGCGGAVFRKQDNDAREAFNTELAKLKQSGKLLELIQPFGFGPETIPPDDMNTETLCKG